MLENLKPLLKGIVLSASTLDYSALIQKADQLATMFGFAAEETAVVNLIKAATAKDARATLDAVGKLLTLVALHLPTAAAADNVAKPVQAINVDANALHDQLDDAFEGGPLVSGAAPVALSPGQIIEIIKTIGVIVSWLRTLKKPA